MRNSKRILILLTALLLSVLLPGAACAENLLINGDFELLDGDGLPSGWYTEQYFRVSGITEYGVTAEGHSGTAVEIVNNDYNDARFVQHVPVEPDSIYLLSGWIRADEISLQSNGIYPARGANLSIKDLTECYTESRYDTNGEWDYVELYGRTGPDQTEVVVYARLGGYSGDSVGIAAFDDLSLVKVEAYPADAVVNPWYIQDDKSAEAEWDDEGAAKLLTEEKTKTAVPDGFWPWMIFFAGVYIAAGLWMQRWLQTDGGLDPVLVNAEKRYRKMREKGWTLSPELCIFIAGLVLAAVVRCIVAWNVTGYGVDIGCFTAWGYRMVENGPWGFYGLNGDYAVAGNFCDYPPGYLYFLAVGEGLHRLSGGLLPQYFVHKLIPMLCDLAAACLVWRIASEHGAKRWQAALLGLLVAFNPANILNSAGWGQVDGVLCLLLMLVAYLALHRCWAGVLPVYVFSILVKPQALMMGFLGLAAIVCELVRDHPQRGGASGGRSGKGLPFRFSRTWKSMGLGLVLSVIVAAVVLIPFCIRQTSATWLFELYGKTLGSYNCVTINTTNLYYFFGYNWMPNVYSADHTVVMVLLLLSAIWSFVTYLRRKDRVNTYLEPLAAAALTVGAAAAALAVLSLLSGEPFRLTTGNPWEIYAVETQPGHTEYFREFAGELPGTWALTFSPWVLLGIGVLLLYAGATLVWMIFRRIRTHRQQRVHTGLIEPVLMGLFAVAFAGMLIFDTTWTAVGTVAMAMAFAVVLPMFLRSGKLSMLPICGAVLFILLYAFGLKMHERYVFPAIFLLAMAYAIRRDRRLLWLLIGMSCTLMINEGIILDNDLRLAAGHVNSDADSLWLTYVNAFAVTAMAIWSVWLCQRICVEGEERPLVPDHRTPMFPVRTRKEDPCTPLTFRDTSRVRYGRIDAVLIAAVTLVYSVVALTTLGSTRAPQNPWKSGSYNERIIFDLGQRYESFSMLYYAQVSYRDFSVATADTDSEWPANRTYWAEMAEGQCFRWKYLTPSYVNSEGEREYYGGDTPNSIQRLSGRYVCITAQQTGLILDEIIFRDAQGNRIPARIWRTENIDPNEPGFSDPAFLLDEQDTLPDGEEPSWWNSTYFDEIYHARTAYEHATNQYAYEWTHPPLGKIIMSWFIQLFGMTPFGWRFGGALCGILMLPAMYLLGKQLTKRTDMGFAAMTLMALDCMHLTQTSIATIDSYPVLFIILSYFFMLRFMQRDIIRDRIRTLLPDLALCGFFMGCGVASKWIGIYAGVGLAVLYFWTCLRHLHIGILSVRMKKSGRPVSAADMNTLNARDLPALRRVIFLCLWCLLFFVAVPLAIYIWSYSVHYSSMNYQSVPEYLLQVARDGSGAFLRRMTASGGYQLILSAMSCLFMLRLLRRDLVRDGWKRLIPDLVLCAFFLACDVTSGWCLVYVGTGLAVLYAAAWIRYFRVPDESGKLRWAWNIEASDRLLLMSSVGIVVFFGIQLGVYAAFALINGFTPDVLRLWKGCLLPVALPSVLGLALSYVFMLRFVKKDVLHANIRACILELGLSALFLACALAFSWTAVFGAAGLLVMFVWKCVEVLRNDCTRPDVSRVVRLILWFVLFFVVIVFVFTLAAYALTHQTQYPRSPLYFLINVWDTQVGMLNYHGQPGLGMDHPYYTPWYEWITMQKPMYYAAPSFAEAGKTFAIWCFGNPALWLTGIAGMAYTVFRWLKGHRYRRGDEFELWHLHADTWVIEPAFVLIGFLAQLLPWVLVPRGTYIYHYFASVPFIILGTVLLLSSICRERSELGRSILLVYLSLSLTMFVILFPPASGVSVPESWFTFIRSYPWINQTGNGIMQRIHELMIAFPLFPNI